MMNEMLLTVLVRIPLEQAAEVLNILKVKNIILNFKSFTPTLLSGAKVFLLTVSLELATVVQVDGNKCRSRAC